jgi:hypothetical protein
MVSPSLTVVVNSIAPVNGAILLYPESDPRLEKFLKNVTFLAFPHQRK